MQSERAYLFFINILSWSFTTESHILELSFLKKGRKGGKERKERRGGRGEGCGGRVGEGGRVRGRGRKGRKGKEGEERGLRKGGGKEGRRNVCLAGNLCCMKLDC